jgi:hypothetical protein
MNMAQSTCAKCGGRTFELIESEPIGTNFKWQFVQCVSCGVPIGVVDYFATGQILLQVQEDINKIKKKLEIR